MQINFTTEVITLGLGLLGTMISGAFIAGGLYVKIRQNINDTTKIQNGLDQYVKDNSAELKSMSTKLDILVGKVSVILKDSIADELSGAASPRQLNEQGRKVLRDSSIEQVLEPKFEEIVEKVKNCDPQNPYQAQEALFEVVLHLREDEGLRSAIENGAFLSGHSPEEVLYVGALNIRDHVIEELGLSVGDIDKHDPSQNSK